MNSLKFSIRKQKWHTLRFYCHLSQEQADILKLDKSAYGNTGLATEPGGIYSSFIYLNSYPEYLLFFLFPAISRHLIFVYFLSIFSIKMSSHVKMDSNISLTMRCKWTLQLNISCLLLFPYPLFIAQNNQPVDLLVRLAVEYSPEVEKLGD